MPALPSMTPGASATFIFREQVTSGLDAYFWTDYSLYSANAANQAPPGNYVKGSILAAEVGGGGQVAPWNVDPVASIGTPGPSPDLPPVPNTPYGAGLVLQFYTVQGSGVYTMQDGTAAGTGAGQSICGNFITGFNPCQSVYITASGARPRIAGPPSALDYNFQSINFLDPLDPRPDASGPCGGPGFSPGGVCTLTTEVYPGVGNTLPAGQYLAWYTINLSDENSANIPQPSPVTVYVVLTVTPPPTVTLTPNPINFTYNVGAPATVPPSQVVNMQASAASGPIGFTLTPQASTATVLLSVNGGAYSTNPVNGCIVSGSLTNCNGSGISITAAIFNPLGTLTTPGAFGGTILVTIPPVNPVTLLPNSPVANAAFSVPVYVTVNSSPFLAISPNVAFDWTVGQANAVVHSGSTNTMTINLTGNDSYTVASNQAWAVVSAPVPNSSAAVSTVTVSINTAAAPTAAGTATATITVTGLSGEFATATVSLYVAAKPVVLFSPASPLSFTYYKGDTDSADVAPFNVTVTPTNTPENPTFALTATPDQPSWCTVTSGPGSVNNTGGPMKITLDPLGAALAVSATPYVCNITVAGGASITSNVFTISLTVAAQLLNAPVPNTFYFNMPTNATAPANQNIAMTGKGTFLFNTTPTVVIPIGGTWLGSSSVNLVNGAGTLTLTATDTGLGNGQYAGTVAYTGPVGNPVPFNTAVYLNVGTIGATPASETFAYTIGYTTPASATVALASGQATGLGFTVSSTASWLTCTVNQTITPATLTVAYIPTGLTAAGSPYSGQCQITTTGSSNPVLAVPVTLTVTSEPTLSASVAGGNNPAINLFGVLGGSNPTFTFTITGNGLPTGNTMPFSVTGVTSTPSWLSVSPMTGNVGAGGTPLLVTVSMAALGAGAQPGTYDGSFMVSSPNSANALTVSVILTVTGVQPFFLTEASVGGGYYFMNFQNGTLFGYYTFLQGTPSSANAIIYHSDMGYEYVLPADSLGNVYMYDFATGHWFFTGSGLFPYLYDFTLNTWIYYVPNTKVAGHYTTGPRTWVNLTTGKTFTM